MSEVEQVQFETGGETYEIYIESKQAPNMPNWNTPGDDRPTYGLQPKAAVPKIEQARRVIRGYALYALSAFQNLGLAEVEEVNLKFGLRMGGKAGIPYITEGSAESNLEISVTCKFPTPQSTRPQ